MILVRNSGLSLLLSGFRVSTSWPFLTLKPAPIYFRMKTLLENRGNDSCSLLDPPTDIWVDPVFPTAVSAQSAHRTRRGKKCVLWRVPAISAVYIGWWFQILKTAVNIRQWSSILRLWSELTKNIRFIMIHPTFQDFPLSIFHVIFRSWSHLTYFGRSPGGPGHIHISQRAFKASRCRKVWRQRTDSTHHCLHLWGRVGLGLIGWFQVSRCLKSKNNNLKYSASRLGIQAPQSFDVLDLEVLNTILTSCYILLWLVVLLIFQAPTRWCEWVLPGPRIRWMIQPASYSSTGWLVG